MNQEHSGNKYVRVIHGRNPAGVSINVDVYNVLEAYNVTCQARGHAIKKLLCAGLRGKGDVQQDLQEALDAVCRAIQLQKDRDHSQAKQENECRTIQAISNVPHF